jgi:DNA-binding CsgD family transcriptional regulator
MYHTLVVSDFSGSLNDILYLWEMLNNLTYLIFILSVALAAGGVVISAKLRSSFQHGIFSTLLYYQVFIYTFGFYGIWGQVVLRAFLSSYIKPDYLERFSDLLMLMGMPFLVVAWLMLLQLCLDISGKNRPKGFAASYLLVNLSLLLLLGIFIMNRGGTRPISVFKYYFIVFDFIYSFLAFLFLLIPGKRASLINARDRKIIALAILSIMVIQCIPLVIYNSQVYLAIIFIFTFFAGSAFLPVYLKYGALLTGLAGSTQENLSLEDFCRKFEVSPRETDIVKEICNGLSNKEISDKLFISLQTVKDHTHRIYIKTNVRSRVQLINLVKEMTDR